MNIRDKVYLELKKVCDDLGIPTDKLEVSRSEFADYSSPIALRFAKDLQKSPFEIVQLIRDKLIGNDFFQGGELEGSVDNSGFVNLWVNQKIWQNEVVNVLNSAKRYGTNDKGKGKKARVEFVSANPTGPLHFGNARGGPIGDTLARVLEASGYDVLREYLHNDVGEQVRKLGESILNVAKGAKLEDQEYKGEYIRELAERILGPVSSFLPASAHSSKKLETKSDSKSEELRAEGSPSRTATQNLSVSDIGKRATDLMLDETLVDCEAMGIKFDKVYLESGFVSSGDTERALKELKEKGVLKEKDGATWFAPSDEFLKDRETVVVKSDGSYTYFSNDIAYHKIKFSEGYDLVVDIFGANHHGHVPRLQAVIKALGGDVSRFHVILYQWVRFKKGGEVLAMSKRSGNFITAKEILEMVGPDAVRFFVLMHDPNSHIDFDLDLAREKSNKNPVFYVQYAHARICSILAKAPMSVILSASEGSKAKDSSSSTQNDNKMNYSVLVFSYELALIKKITQLPELVEDIASNFGVNALTTYATELADTFHKFYENCRVLPSDDETKEQVSEELTLARLALVDATRITLANTLRLLGISAPEKM